MVTVGSKEQKYRKAIRSQKKKKKRGKKSQNYNTPVHGIQTRILNEPAPEPLPKSGAGVSWPSVHAQRCL